MFPIDTTAPPRRATPADRRHVTRVLTSGFLDDPVFAWCIPSRDERLVTLPPFFDAFADAFARHDATEVVGTPTPTGVALWAPFGAPPVHPEDAGALDARIAAIAGENLERFGICSQVFEAAHPHEPAWFLQFIAVEASARGRGLGSALLRSVLDRADAAGEAAYLEATSPQNRALYERHGFRVIEELPLPAGPTAWAMWRDPR